MAFLADANKYQKRSTSLNSSSRKRQIYQLESIHSINHWTFHSSFSFLSSPLFSWLQCVILRWYWKEKLDTSPSKGGKELMTSLDQTIILHDRRWYCNYTCPDQLILRARSSCSRLSSPVDQWYDDRDLQKEALFCSKLSCWELKSGTAASAEIEKKNFNNTTKNT